MIMLSPINRLPSAIRWGLLLPLIGLNAGLVILVCQYLQPLVNILITASLLAFLLDYPILFLEKRGIKRALAISLVFSLALVLFGTLALILVPLILQQLEELLARLPAWLEHSLQQLQALTRQIDNWQAPIDLSSLANEVESRLSTALESLTSAVLDLLLETFNSIVNILLTLVFTISLVVSGENIWQGFLRWLPPVWKQQVDQSMRQNFQNYFAGQAILGLVLSVLMIVAFVILQVPFSLLFGLAIGLLSVIPFGGVLSISLVSFLVGLQDLGLGLRVLLIAIVIGQINDNVIGPRIMGSLTGISPVWLLISLWVGAKVDGILGLIVAVPLAGFFKNTIDMLAIQSTQKDE